MDGVNENQDTGSGLGQLEEVVHEVQGQNQEAESLVPPNTKCLHCGAIFESNRGCTVHLFTCRRRKGLPHKPQGERGIDWEYTIEPFTRAKGRNYYVPVKDRPEGDDRPYATKKSRPQQVVGEGTTIVKIPVILEVPIFLGKAKLGNNFNLGG